MSNVVVAQFYTKNVSYGVYAKEINEAYCKSKGYTYFCEEDTDKIRASLDSRAATWYKPKLIAEVLDLYNPEYVLFLDIDAIISDTNQSIEDFIDPNYDLVLTEDYSTHCVVNAGVILIKNTEWSKTFLKTWWESGDIFQGNQATRLEVMPQNLEKVGYFKYALWHDQTCFTILYENNEDVRNHVKIIEKRSFNHSEYDEGNFIFHAFAYGFVPNRKLDVIHRERLAKESSLENINLIVYHIYCVGNYLEIVEKQLERLKKSGLYDWCDKLEITCINESDTFESIDDLVKDLTKANLNKFIQNQYEYEGIKKVWEYSQKYSGKVLYFHTKGVSNDYINLDSREKSDWKIKGISWWKEAMEYFLIDNYETCISKLDDYNQCGLTNNSGWWWGNFWWSNLSWVQLNQEPAQSTRWTYEAWLNNHRTPSYHEFYHFDFNPYYTILPDDIYRTKDLYKDAKLEVVSAFYGALGEQQDEGKPLVDRIVVDVTDVIKQNLTNNNSKGFDIRVDNSLKGEDPCFGIVKMLEVNLLINDIQYTVAVEENRKLKFHL